MKTEASYAQMNIKIATELAKQACITGDLDTVKELESRGFDLDNTLCINHACSNGQLRIVKYLKEYGINLSNSDEMALYLAGKYGHLEIVKYLVENDCDIHVDGIDMVCEEFGHLPVVKYLVEQGCKIRKVTVDHAKDRGYMDVYNYLTGKLRQDKLKKLLDE